MNSGPPHRAKPVSSSVEDAEEATVVLGNVRSLTGVHPDDGRTDQLRWPLAYVAAFLVEDLYPVVLAIGYKYLPIGIDEHSVGQVELPSAASGVAPALDVLSLSRELVDTAVSIAVSDEYVAVRGDCDARREVEWLAAVGHVHPSVRAENRSCQRRCLSGNLAPRWS